MSSVVEIASGIDRALVFEFVATFAKTEYALKRAGYVVPNAQRADVAWDRFAAAKDEVFVVPADTPVGEAIGYLLREPPRKQVAPAGHLRWQASDRNNEPLLRWLTVLVRRVRNNLLHGGKFATGPEPDSSRSTKLLSASLVIMRHIDSLDNEVNSYFRDTLG